MPLPTAEDYRSRAAAVLERAEKLPVGAQRMGLLRIASQWARLAQFKEDQELD